VLFFFFGGGGGFWGLNPEPGAGWAYTLLSLSYIASPTTTAFIKLGRQSNQ
jgi:hypothetical protein